MPCPNCSCVKMCLRVCGGGRGGGRGRSWNVCACVWMGNVVVGEGGEDEWMGMGV